jgi:hypothetical protein
LSRKMKPGITGMISATATPTATATEVKMEAAT